MNDNMARPIVPIPDVPSEPYPLKEASHIVSGFGRGSSDLGIPTANVPISTLSEEFRSLEPGVYFGFCRLKENKQTELVQPTKGIERKVVFNYGCELNSDQTSTVYPHVMSIGWNPFYNNKEKTAEIHIINKFSSDFYGANINFNILGYIRPELDYTTKEALIEDINIDIKTALKYLEKRGYKDFSEYL
ncbi:riboflavin kinase [Saccharomycopsis crataegensis]|uniref:Riboflavin kinase n=1 Tax=Saccharomycopsis crataegensis TaxID=43959 RepID=A0AAV5QFL3_9ASCO|nr:riboflavin kinase [Saccharomycopsis crataegensis]